MGKIIVGEL